MLLRDIELAFKRFESSDITGLIEYSLLMNVIRGTHEQLSELLVSFFFMVLLFLFFTYIIFVIYI